METGYSLSDISAVTGGMNGLGGNNSIVTLLLLFALVSGGLGWGGRGDYGQFATAASQQDILFGQKFSDLDNKMDRGFTSLGNGISSATFSINNSLKDGNAMVAGRVVDEGRAMQAQLADCCCTTQRNIDSVRFDMANYSNAIQQNDTVNTQKILDAIAQNKIESLQGRINQLELQAAMCGVVRYPNSMTFDAGRSPFCNCGGCGCGNI